MLPTVTRGISCFVFFNDTATTEIYTLSLHDALPISGRIDESPKVRKIRQERIFTSAASPKGEAHAYRDVGGRATQEQLPRRAE